jgi:hypothetical protein
MSLRLCLTFVKRLSKYFSHVEISALHAYFSRMAYKRPAKHQPLTVRFRVPQRAAILSMAARRGMTVPALLRSFVLPHIDVASDVELIQVVTPSIPQRSIVAPENRGKTERPANGSGFADRLK